MIRNISIPTQNVDNFNHRIAKLNKRAIKLGVTPVTITISGTELKQFGTQGYKPYFVEFTMLEILGDDPILDGYRLIASIDQDNVMGVMINVVPGLELPVSFRNSNGSCNHCNTKRNRKKTVVVQHVPTGKYMEIGRMCLKDFLPSGRIDRYSMLESFISSIDNFVEASNREWNDGSGRYEPIHSLELVLACAIKSISDNGYISKTYACEQSQIDNTIFSTASTMGLMLYGNKYDKVAPYSPTSDEFTEATKIAAWAKTVNPDSDYNYNIHQIAVAELVKDKYMGFAVSIIPAYRRAMGLIATKEAKDAKTPSEYVGEIGKRVEFNLSYLGEYSFSSYYGLTTIYRFQEGAGNNVVWMSVVREDFEVGKEYHVKASVKKHDVYREEKQTTLTRVKIQ